MTQEDLQKALEALGKGGITVAGDLVLEKHVEHEVNGVEAGGIGIQIVNGKEPQGKPEPSQAGGMDERQREIVAKLKPIFYGDEGKARQFLLGIEGMKPTLITQKVNQLVKEKTISDLSCKHELWSVLHEYGLYEKTESNWNQQVR